MSRPDHTQLAILGIQEHLGTEVCHFSSSVDNSGLTIAGVGSGDTSPHIRLMSGKLILKLSPTDWSKSRSSTLDGAFYLVNSDYILKHD